ncbi:hypothetical protein [Terribacillus saccharophilus]|uniref:hypothetical protein n=1 Tax=Terribacillus saccharophilus TaxID=361277 RepID=UPI002DC9FA0F|nr:hypothetical protein [Terribacillus saccharophilus]
MIDFLLDLVFDSKLNTQFIIMCKNDDPELVHAYHFSTKKLLKEFIVDSNLICPNCGAPLDTSDIRVAFLKKTITYSTPGGS